MKFCFTFDDIYNTMPKICEKNESGSKYKVRLLGKQRWLLYVGYRWHSSLDQFETIQDIAPTPTGFYCGGGWKLGLLSTFVISI